MTKSDWLNVKRCAEARFNAWYLDPSDRYVGEADTAHMAYKLAYRIKAR